jgi:hypothetical protein
VGAPHVVVSVPGHANSHRVREGALKKKKTKMKTKMKTKKTTTTTTTTKSERDEES